MKVKTVSIPQAVGTVATHMKRLQLLVLSHVSIPQAVGTVATGRYLPYTSGRY